MTLELLLLNNLVFIAGKGSSSHLTALPNKVGLRRKQTTIFIERRQNIGYIKSVK